MQRESMAATAADAQAPMFARSTGLPASMGKATCAVKTLVPDEVNDDLVRVAREHGMTVSDFLRNLILVRLYGFDMVASMQRRSLEMVAGIGTESVR
ncbi:MAG TPA: hypothetical protein VIP05_31190 [Burkholderiaceae bacterium]